MVRVLHERTGHRSVTVGVPRIRLHDLRHTYATLELSAGTHSRNVSERMGHASVSWVCGDHHASNPATTFAQVAPSLVPGVRYQSR
jgi:integrase